MVEISALDDERLMAQAREWRLRALRGERDARGHAHELEREVRRRSARQISSNPTRNFDDQMPKTQQPSARRRWLF